ncbi:MAG: hypothetical protein ACW98Y_15565 [Candidatus Thorarchaeota archaeon]|jgi:hypothetical protein
MWSPDISDFQPDDDAVKAEYRTDRDHLRVIKLDTGFYVLQTRSRTYEPDVDLYTPWSGWLNMMEHESFSKVMWIFAQESLERSAVDEYTWGEMARHL